MTDKIKTHWTTNFLNSGVLTYISRVLYQAHQIITFYILHCIKVVTDQNLTLLLMIKKKRKNKKKMRKNCTPHWFSNCHKLRGIKYFFSLIVPGVQVGEPHTRKTKMRKKMKKIWGKWEKLDENEERFSCWYMLCCSVCAVSVCWWICAL